MSEKKTFVIDIDGTICSQEDSGSYDIAAPDMEMIRKINSLYTEGHKIILYTARGMNTCEGNIGLVRERYSELTKEWLKDNRVCYDQLVFGKPPGDYYVDDKAMKLDEFISTSV